MKFCYNNILFNALISIIIAIITAFTTAKFGLSKNKKYLKYEMQTKLLSDMYECLVCLYSFMNNKKSMYFDLEELNEENPNKMWNKIINLNFEIEKRLWLLDDELISKWLDLFKDVSENTFISKKQNIFMNEMENKFTSLKEEILTEVRSISKKL